MTDEKSLSILLLAPGSNPNILTDSLIGYSLGEALARQHQVTLVVRARDEEPMRQASCRFFDIQSVASPWLDHIYDWIFRRVFKRDRGNILWTAIRYPIPVVFEWRVWNRFRNRIRRKEFDVVLRITPVVPMMPSPMAHFMRKTSTPFVIGPLNGSLPFDQLPKQRATAGYWAARMRGLYRFLPFSRSTYTHSKAIITGSSHTYAEFSRFRDKAFFVPGENGVRSSMIEDREGSEASCNKTLELVFVGRLVPLKGCDLALRGASRLLRSNKGRLTILGDGPERSRLELLADELHIRESVEFRGMVAHSEVLSRLRSADILLFPSLRDFGAGVVFEALATGAVPVVVDQGGPGDIVRDDVGFRIRLDSDNVMVKGIEEVLELLASDPKRLETLRRSGQAYARSELTWEKKAQMVTSVLLWSIGSGPKPRMMPPKTTKVPV